MKVIVCLLFFLGVTFSVFAGTENEVRISWPRLPLVNFSTNSLDAQVTFGNKAERPSVEDSSFIRNALIDKLQRLDCSEDDLIFNVDELKQSLNKALGDKKPSEISLCSHPSYSQPYKFALQFSLEPKDHNVAIEMDFSPLHEESEGWSEVHLQIKASVSTFYEKWTPSQLHLSLSQAFDALWDPRKDVNTFSEAFIEIIFQQYPFFENLKLKVSGKKISDEEEMEDISILCKYHDESQRVG